MGVRRTIGRASIAVVALIVAMASAAPPAGAETTLDADLAFDRLVRFAKPSLLRITIDADRLIDGHIEIVQSQQFGGPQSLNPVVQRAAVQIAGGTTKEVLLVVEAPQMEFGTQLRVRLVEGDEEIATTRVTAANPRNNDIVGVLPELYAAAPERLERPTDSGHKVFVELQPQWIDLAGAIDSLEVVALTPAEFAGLAAPARDTLVRWSFRGGTLAVVGPRADTIADEIDGIEAIEGNQNHGLGAVRLVTSTANWAESLGPTRLQANPFGGPESELLMGGMFFGPQLPISAALAEDAGVRLPSLPWLTGLLAVYLLVVGPLAWLIARRLGRTPALWVAIPVVALLFTGAVWVAGSNLRSGNDTAHATIIEVTPAGPHVRTSTLLTSRQGGVEAMPIPDGWRLDSSVANTMFFGPMSTGDGTPIQGIDMLSEPKAAATLDAGGFGVVQLAGTVDRFDHALRVTATSDDNGHVRGAITNNLGVDVHDVGLFADLAGTNLGSIEAGQTVEFDLRGGARDPFQGQPVEFTVWPELNDGMFFDGPFAIPGAAPAAADESDDPVDDAFSPALWSEFSSTDPAGRPIGQVVVAGFTRELASPLDPAVTQGRTMIVARAPIETTSSITDLTVSRIGIGVSELQQARMWGLTSHWLFTLPQAWQPGTALALETPTRMESLSVWNGSDWDTLDTSADASRPVIELPESVIRDRQVIVKIAILGEFGPPTVGPRELVIREPEPGEETISYLVAIDDDQAEDDA